MHDWHKQSAASEILNSSFAFVSDKQEEKQPVLEILKGLFPKSLVSNIQSVYHPIMVAVG